MFIISEISSTDIQIGDQKLLKTEQDINLTTASWCTTLGKLQVKGVCLIKEYHANEPPESEGTNIYHVFHHTKILEVDEKKKAITFDINLSLLWEDHRIKTNFSDVHKKNGGIRLSEMPPYFIWFPYTQAVDILTAKRLFDDSHFADLRLSLIHI